MSETIKSLEKSITVLKTIQSFDGVSLSELHKITHFSKPSLSRILNTFELTNVIRKSLIDGLYRSNYSLDSSSDFSVKSFLNVAATEVLDELCSSAVWPSDLLVRNGNYMEVAETSRKKTRLGIYRDKRGDRVNMIYSAVGRAYLAFCPESEREELIRSLRASNDPFYGQAKDSQWLNSIIEKTRAQGFGERNITASPLKKDEPLMVDGLSAIAVPVFQDDHLGGCINMLWPSRAFSTKVFVKENLERLLNASLKIQERVTELRQNQ